MKMSDYIKKLSRDTILTIVLFLTLATVAFSSTFVVQNTQKSKEISEQNNRFLNNFSNYMRCLIVNEDEVVIAVGEDKYVELCEELLFRGTGDRPKPIIVTIPPNFIPTTTTTAPAG
jgi:hypothetical protein